MRPRARRDPRRPPLGHARSLALSLAALAVAAGADMGRSATADPLPSWRETGPREAVIDFVARVTTQGGPDFVPEPERIAVFDNDGTLWAEQPMYAQLAFALDRVRALAPEHPEWSSTEPFASVLAGDPQAALSGGDRTALEIVTATHAGTTTEEFDGLVREWMAGARHPATGRPYTSMVYAPMLELLSYLRAHGFRTFIVSGGGVEFMRAWAEDLYGIPREQIIGSSVRTEYRLVDGRPALVRLPEIDFVDDGAGKPVGIERHVGRRPVFAFGNSDGDLEMLAWTAAGSGPRFAGLVHHTDARREWAYDRDAGVGRLDRAIDRAGEEGWTVVDMAADWEAVFPEE